MKKQTEKQIHRDAFEYHYKLSCSGTATRKAVAVKFNVSQASISKWKASFNWNQRVADRKDSIQAKVEQKVDKAIVDKKVSDMKTVDRHISRVSNILDKSVNIEIIDSVSKYSTMVTSFVALQRLKIELESHLEGKRSGSGNDSIMALVDGLSRIVNGGGNKKDK